MKRAIAMVVAFCALVGAAVGAFVMYAAWSDNPQNAYYEGVGDGRVVHWGYGGCWDCRGFLSSSYRFLCLAAVSSPCRITSISGDPRLTGRCSRRTPRPSARARADAVTAQAAPAAPRCRGTLVHDAGVRC